jgi:hypothetical protein
VYPAFATNLETGVMSLFRSSQQRDLQDFFLKKRPDNSCEMPAYFPVEENAPEVQNDLFGRAH